MCSINWNLVAEMFTGTGTLLLGIAAMLTLLFQFGYRAKSKHLEASLKLMLLSYKQYMAGEEGIVWANYPANADQIINGISNKTGLDKKQIKELLDSLKTEGKI